MIKRRDSMKKILGLTGIVILIPFLVVLIFVKEIKEQNINSNVINNKNVRIQRTNGSIDTVPFESYIIGVLAGEMPANFELEALKAQALAARSYVLKKMEQNKNNDYDIVDTVMNQVYLDESQMKAKWKDQYEEKLQKITKAVNDTQGEYIAYNGEVIQAFFFSTSSGKTENSEEVFQESLPYLRSVDSTWDSDVSPVFNEIYKFTLEEFYQKLNLPYEEKLQINIVDTTSTGRIKNIEINRQKFKASDLTKLLNLRSTYFNIEQNGNIITIQTKGYGHGVGMSQYGAQAMALKGYNYQEIIKYYYQNVEILKMEV
jgi:stage II sporulation protein D